MYSSWSIGSILACLRSLGDGGLGTKGGIQQTGRSFVPFITNFVVVVTISHNFVIDNDNY